jgi:hypothetical protein
VKLGRPRLRPFDDDGNPIGDYVKTAKISKRKRPESDTELPFPSSKKKKVEEGTYLPIIHLSSVDKVTGDETSTPKRKGRPAKLDKQAIGKSTLDDTEGTQSSAFIAATPAAKKRGQSPKKKVHDPKQQSRGDAQPLVVDVGATNESLGTASGGRKRGRPPKKNPQQNDGAVPQDIQGENPPSKRGKCRPEATASDTTDGIRPPKKARAHERSAKIPSAQMQDVMTECAGSQDRRSDVEASSVTSTIEPVPKVSRSSGFVRSAVSASIPRDVDDAQADRQYASFLLIFYGF